MPTVAIGNRFHNALYGSMNGRVDATSALLNFAGSDDFSIYMIIQPKAFTSSQSVLSIGDGLATTKIAITTQSSSNRILITVNGSGIVGSMTNVNSTFAAGKLNYICFTKSGTSLNAYCDNQLIVTSTVPTTTIDGNVLRLFRSQSNGFDFDGLFYRVLIFNRALTLTEIQTLNNNDGLIYKAIRANCILNWEFKEKSGNTLFDASGNAINGTISGFNTTLGAGNRFVNFNEIPIAA